MFKQKKLKPPVLTAVYVISGTGKTMLMDMFYQHCKVRRKQRVHFHKFMLDVHKSRYQ